MLPAQIGRGCPREPGYDPEAETLIGGTVGEVEEVESPSGQIGIHFILEIDEAIYEVCVGPASFLEEEEFALTTDDEVTVLGAWWWPDEETPSRLIAREVTVRDRVLVLRDAGGGPRWETNGQ